MEAPLNTIAMDMLSLLTCKKMPVLFNDRPSFSAMVARAREELHCLRDDDDGIAVEGVLHLGSPPNILRRMIPIGCADQWKNYVRTRFSSQH